jgi:hypothetical protein
VEKGKSRSDLKEDALDLRRQEVAVKRKRETIRHKNRTSIHRNRATKLGRPYKLGIYTPKLRLKPFQLITNMTV